MRYNCRVSDPSSQMWGAATDESDRSIASPLPMDRISALMISIHLILLLLLPDLVYCAWADYDGVWCIPWQGQIHINWGSSSLFFLVLLF